MDKKYEILDDFIMYNYMELHRIKALKDFGNVKAGSIGGYIQYKHNLSQKGNCWIYDDAMVYGNANVKGSARIMNDAMVYGCARINGDAKIYDNAIITDNAKIYGCASIYNNAFIYDDAKVYEFACVGHDAIICGNSEVSGTASIFTGCTIIAGNSQIKNKNDCAIVSNFGTLNRTTTFSRQSDGSIYVVCGCFQGSIDEFRKIVKETHKDNHYAKEYLMIADLMEMRFKNRQEGSNDKN